MIDYAEQLRVEQVAALATIRRIAASLPGYQVNSAVESGIINRRGDLVLATPKPPLTPVLALVGADAVKQFNPIPKLTSEQTERFWAKVDVPYQPSCCWEWQASRTADGYGQFALYPSGTFYAHRVAYTLLVGVIPNGLAIDHLCRNPMCVNPDHLDPVSNRENNRRGVSNSAVNSRKTHCAYGHEFTPENTSITPAGRRQCRICRRRLSRKHQARETERRQERRRQQEAQS